MKKFTFFFLAVVLTVTMVLIGCAKSTTITTTTSGATTTATAGKPVDGGIFRAISVELPAGSIGIPENMGGLSALYMSSVFERLLLKDAKGEIIPQLASGFTWSNNNLTLTMPLRKGIKFSDGTDFNADAALWNINRRIAAGIQGTLNIASVKKLDDYQIQINLKTYQNTWFESFGGAGNGATLGIMISPTAYQTLGEEKLNWNPVGIGTGPFKFKSYDGGTMLELVRNEGYWGPKPHLDGITWKFITDPVTAELSFEKGEADMIWEIGGPAQLLHNLVPKGYKNVDLSPGLAWVLVPSSGNPNSPWAKQQVREAAEYAIDKKGITDTVLYGYATPLTQICISNQLPYDPSYQGRGYDPAKARQLLTAAGYPNGFKTNLYIAEQINGNYMPAIQANLKAVGIDATLQVVSTGKWIEMETNGWDEGLDMSPQGAGPFGQFIMRYWIRPTQPNWSSGLYWKTMYRPPELDDLINKYLAEPTSQGQITSGRAVVKLMTDQALAIQLWVANDAHLMKDYVHDTNFGTAVLVDGIFNFTGAWMSPH